MKRKAFLLSLLALSGYFLLGAAACEDEHVHSFASGWTHDDTQHWHVCDGENCDEVAERAEHSLENGSCTVCGYEQPQEPPSATVTQAQFETALSFDGVSSLTVTLTDDDGSSALYMDGNKTRLVSPSGESYYEVCDGYAYSFIYMDEATAASAQLESGWYRTKLLPESDAYRDIVTLHSFVGTYLNGLDYSDFTYADGSYTGLHTYSAETADEWSPDISLTFADGTLLSVVFSYTEDGQSRSLTYAFSDWNATVVTLPDPYVELGDHGGADGAEEWAALFAFENVTINVSSSVYYPEYRITVNDSYTLKTDGDRLGYSTADYYYKEQTYDDFYVYYDGTDYYVNGSPDEPEYEEQFTKTTLTFDFDFSYYGGNFTKQSENVYVCETLSLYGTTTYENVTIALDGGKISTIAFSLIYSVGGSSCTYTYQISCSAWGTTSFGANG